MNKACGMVYPTSIADTCLVGERLWRNSFEVEAIEITRTGDDPATMTGTTINGTPFRASYPEWQFKPYPAQKDDEQDLNDCIGATEARIKSGDLQVDGKWHSASLGDGDIPALIAERGSRYGKFKDGAEIMQELKDVMRSVDGWSNLSASQKEAMDMIQHKIGRILNGDPNYDDSWKDVAGYATLIVNELNGEIK